MDEGKSVTFSGYYAWRDTINGSWFIQSLCKMLEEHYKTRELLSILTLVNRDVAINYESVSKYSELHKKKQMCCIASMLTRLLYF